MVDLIVWIAMGALSFVAYTASGHSALFASGFLGGMVRGRRLKQDILTTLKTGFLGGILAGALAQALTFLIMKYVYGGGADDGVFWSVARAIAFSIGTSGAGVLAVIVKHTPEAVQWIAKTFAEASKKEAEKGPRDDA